MPDYNLEGALWNSHTISWSFATVNLNAQPANFSSFLQAEAFEQEIVDALANWATVANITFVQVSDSSSADTRFGFVTFDGPFGILATTNYYHDGFGHFLPDVTIRFDQGETYSYADDTIDVLSFAGFVSSNGGVTFTASYVLPGSAGTGHVVALNQDFGISTDRGIVSGGGTQVVEMITQTADGHLTDLLVKTGYGGAPIGQISAQDAFTQAFPGFNVVDAGRVAHQNLFPMA